MKEYQLIVIGAGPGGYVAALRAAKLGMTVAVVENREAGGTCLNRGCIPTKTLLHSSEAYHAATASAGIGIHVEGARADMNEIFAYKRQISAKLSSGIESLFKGAKIDLIRGRAQITAPGRVHVELNEGGCDELAAGFENVGSYVSFYDYLRSQGYGEDLLDRIFYENLLKLL